MLAQQTYPAHSKRPPWLLEAAQTQCLVNPPLKRPWSMYGPAFDTWGHGVHVLVHEQNHEAPGRRLKPVIRDHHPNICSWTHHVGQHWPGMCRGNHLAILSLKHCNIFIYIYHHQYTDLTGLTDDWKSMLHIGRYLFMLKQPVPKKLKYSSAYVVSVR